jgi:glycosyltransferase involved in cell wall biosynthesis
LGNVVFTGPVSKEQVREYWKLCDAALVLLRDSPLFAHVLPSKMFEAMGMERPIILGVRGESASLLERARAGIVIAPEDAQALAQAIRTLAQDKAAARNYGMAGRAFASTEYNRDLLARRMLDVLEAAAGA